jgi:hypothetical protein
VWCCNGTTASGPAWRWHSRCGAVCFSCLPIGAGLCFDGDFMGTRRLLAAAARLCSTSVVQWCGFDQVDVPIQPVGEVVLSAYSRWHPNPTRRVELSSCCCFIVFSLLLFVQSRLHLLFNIIGSSPKMYIGGQLGIYIEMHYSFFCHPWMNDTIVHGQLQAVKLQRKCFYIE